MKITVKNTRRYLFIAIALILSYPVVSQESVARQWNEVLLDAIRNDFARPTVHARNLFHVSAAMYDAWAVFSDEANPYLLGNEVHGFTSQFDGYTTPTGELESFREKAISYAAYRLINHRFTGSPGEVETFQIANQVFEDLGYDPAFTSIDFSDGSSAALGNYIADFYSH